MTAIRPRAHLDSGESATDHALLNPEVQTRAAKEVDVIEGERRKPCHIFRFQSIAFDSKLLQNRIHVDRVPESEDVDYKSQCTRAGPLVPLDNAAVAHLVCREKRPAPSCADPPRG